MPALSPGPSAPSASRSRKDPPAGPASQWHQRLWPHPYARAAARPGRLAGAAALPEVAGPSAPPTLPAPSSDLRLKFPRDGHNLLVDLTYLFLDRLALDRAGRQVLLCAAALTADGMPVPLLADRPRGNLEDGWRAVLRAVKASGRLRGLRLVCCDGDRAVVRAIQAELPGTLVQFSLPHRLLAMRHAVSPRHRSRCLAEARAIFRAPSRAEALARYERWVARWSAVGEWAARTFRTEIGLCLTFYRFPEPIRRQLRSAHLAARLFRPLVRSTQRAADLDADFGVEPAGPAAWAPPRDHAVPDHGPETAPHEAKSFVSQDEESVRALRREALGRTGEALRSGWGRLLLAAISLAGLAATLALLRL